jgi:nucleotide-binding universal stress UspA family protein
VDVEGLSRTAKRRAAGNHFAWNKLDTILVAVDGSKSATEAVDFAIDLAVGHESQLTFVHVLPTLDLVSGAIDEGPVALPHDPTDRDRAVLEDAVALATERGIGATTELLCGSAAEAIVDYATECAVDLIVVGSCGHGALSDARMGSVSLGVLRMSTRPVLVVRAGTRPPTA